jgi:hypothetical protein
MLGYSKVFTFSDLKSKEWTSKLGEFKSHIRDEDEMCVVAVMSHGVANHVLAADGVKIPLRSIFTQFDNTHLPQMRAKPKFFIINACRYVLRYLILKAIALCFQ